MPKITCLKCGKKIGALVNYGTAEQPSCYECAHPESKKQTQKVNKVNTTIAFAVFIGGSLLFLGFFHIITDYFAIIPKEHFTYSMTFIKVSDIIAQYNNQSFTERMKVDALFDHLVKQLQNKNMIVFNKPQERPSGISSDHDNEQSNIQDNQNISRDKNDEKSNEYPHDSMIDTEPFSKNPSINRPDWIAADKNTDATPGATNEVQVSSNKVFEEGSVDEPPVLIKSTKPNYPVFIREEGISGLVKGWIVVDKDGTILQVKITSSPHELLSEEVTKSVVRWKYKPAKYKGVPVKMKKAFEIKFDIEE
jgi:TonB family protein